MNKFFALTICSCLLAGGFAQMLPSMGGTGTGGAPSPLASLFPLLAASGGSMDGRFMHFMLMNMLQRGGAGGNQILPLIMMMMRQGNEKMMPMLLMLLSRSSGGQGNGLMSNPFLMMQLLGQGGDNFLRLMPFLMPGLLGGQSSQGPPMAGGEMGAPPPSMGMPGMGSMGGMMGPMLFGGMAGQ